MFGGQLSPTPMFWFPGNYKEECTTSFLPFICVSVLNKILEVQLQIGQDVCGTQSSFRSLECLLWKMTMECAGSVLCTWVCGMCWHTGWLQWKLIVSCLDCQILPLLPWLAPLCHATCLLWDVQCDAVGSRGIQGALGLHRAGDAAQPSEMPLALLNFTYCLHFLNLALSCSRAGSFLP